MAGRSAKGVFFESENIVLVAQPRAADGTILVEGDVTSWDVRAFNPKGVEIFSLLAQPASAVMSAAPVKDGYWPFDNEGRTFLYTVLGDAWTMTGGEVYRIEVRLSTSLYGPVWLVFDAECLALASV